jgi:hypothetical protein
VANSSECLSRSPPLSVSRSVTQTKANPIPLSAKLHQLRGLVWWLTSIPKSMGFSSAAPTPRGLLQLSLDPRFRRAKQHQRTPPQNDAKTIHRPRMKNWQVIFACGHCPEFASNAGETPSVTHTNRWGDSGDHLGETFRATFSLRRITFAKCPT